MPVSYTHLDVYKRQYLPTGCKPYQQHVTGPTFALPAYLKEEFGYETMAIHSYYKKFWNRIRAYPNLGIDTSVSYTHLSSSPCGWSSWCAL